jgi:hypothetical protein
LVIIHAKVVNENYPKGSWVLTARYSNGASLELATGDENFDWVDIKQFKVPKSVEPPTLHPTQNETDFPTSTPTDFSLFDPPTQQPSVAGAGNKVDNKKSDPFLDPLEENASSGKTSSVSLSFLCFLTLLTCLLTCRAFITEQ